MRQLSQAQALTFSALVIRGGNGVRSRDLRSKYGRASLGMVQDVCRTRVAALKRREKQGCGCLELFMHVRAGRKITQKRGLQI
jgi:hypothetical protein